MNVPTGPMGNYTFLKKSSFQKCIVSHLYYGDICLSVITT